MEVWEKINYILDERKINKQEFAQNLIALKPRLKRTGETPSIQTILGYLYGKREIKIELIPYIAEVLNVGEQDLFSSDLEWACDNNVRHSKEVREILSLIPYVPRNVILLIKERFLEYKTLYEKDIT